MLLLTKGNETKSLIELLEYKAQNQPEKKAYIFLENGEIPSVSLTYGDLYKKARAIAAHLQYLQVERALLLYPPGLDFIPAFFGCLYSGTVAVSGELPRPNQSLSQLEKIAKSSQVQIVLTNQFLVDKIKQSFAGIPELAQIRFLATDNIDTALNLKLQEPKIDTDTLACLNYTSGSTGNPKGVMVTHGNLLHNLLMMHEVCQYDIQNELRTSCCWMPLGTCK
ncbi:MAG: AMP-binding protein [Rivularia sp. ALOHA_DT_140]|nr:AMP-binding protein [Rivularia sp. ALOHA_DT_140]